MNALSLHTGCQNPVALRKIEGCLSHIPVATQDTGWSAISPPQWTGLPHMLIYITLDTTVGSGNYLYSPPISVNIVPNSYFGLYNLNFMNHCWPLGPPFPDEDARDAQNDYSQLLASIYKAGKQMGKCLPQV